MITHGNKQISEIVYARKASEGGGAVRLTNIIRGAQVVFGGKVPFNVWLTDAATTAILAAFGQTDGKAVIKATNAYLKALAATDKTKASALAGFINQYPMLVGGLVDTGTKKVTMTSVGKSIFLTDVIPDQASDELYYSFKLLNDTKASSWGREDIWSSNRNAFNCGPASANGTFWYHNPGGYRNSGPQRSTLVGQWLTQFITKRRCGLLGIDEANLGSGDAGTWDAGKYVQMVVNDNIALTDALMKRDDANLIRLIPAADNVLVDVERLIAIQNTGTGNATIEIIETPSTP